MSAARLAAIRARLHAATPGPWLAHDQHDHPDYQVCSVTTGDVVGYAPTHAAGDMLAFLTEDLAWVCDEIERLQSLRDDAQT